MAVFFLTWFYWVILVLGSALERELVYYDNIITLSCLTFVVSLLGLFVCAVRYIVASWHYAFAVRGLCRCVPAVSCATGVSH